MFHFHFARGGRHGFDPFAGPETEGTWQDFWRDRGGFGWGGRPGPRAERGEVKYLILSVLQDGPKHGYEIMKSIEEKSQGAYVPSAGTVYPTLQMLEDMGYVTGREADGRKVFTITDAGRAYAAERQEEAKTAWGRFGPGHGHSGEEGRQLRDELLGLARSLFADGRIFRANAATQARVREILKSTRQQIDATLGEYV